MMYPVENISSAKNSKNTKNIIGVWQKDSKGVAAGLRNCYRFYKNGTVKYSISEFNEESPFKGFIGKYLLTDSILFVKIEKFVEYTDYELEPGASGAYSADWMPFNGKRRLRVAKDTAWIKLPIQLEKGTAFINDYKYYLLSRNPDTEDL